MTHLQPNLHTKLFQYTLYMVGIIPQDSFHCYNGTRDLCNKFVCLVTRGNEFGTRRHWIGAGMD